LDYCSQVAIGVALPWFLLFPDLLRYIVFLLLVSLQCHRLLATLSQLSCSIFFRIRQFAAVWVCLAQKGRLCLVCFVIGSGGARTLAQGVQIFN
jgi:hypothetical protein